MNGDSVSHSQPFLEAQRASALTSSAVVISVPPPRGPAACPGRERGAELGELRTAHPAAAAGPRAARWSLPRGAASGMRLLVHNDIVCTNGIEYPNPHRQGIRV